MTKDELLECLYSEYRCTTPWNFTVPFEVRWDENSVWERFLSPHSCQRTGMLRMCGPANNMRLYHIIVLKVDDKIVAMCAQEAGHCRNCDDCAIIHFNWYGYTVDKVFKRWLNYLNKNVSYCGRVYNLYAEPDGQKMYLAYKTGLVVEWTLEDYISSANGGFASLLYAALLMVNV